MSNKIRRDDAEFTPIMDTLPHGELLLTLVSLWSAMIGGAIGAATGRMIGPMACHITTGFIAGLLSSVILYLPLMGLAQAIRIFIIHKEPVGGTTGGMENDRLAGLLGGAAGAVGAVVVAALPKHSNLFDPQLFVICWTVVAFVAIVLGLGVIYFFRWKDPS
ncbi:MAG: hypothetical protein HY866_08200 [Chloroflexi bacterium]|nr:hypothetical protein [Chloroflexota bacterium]